MVFSATQGQQIARGWLSYDLTGSNTGLGGVYLMFGITMLVFTPIGGVVSDRMRRRRVLVTAGAVLALTAATIGLADSFGWLALWMLMASAAVHGTTISMYGPARMAFTAELVEERHLPSAIALSQTGLNAAKVVAPSIAGLMISIAWIGTRGVYLVCAVLLVFATVRMAQLPTGGPGGTGATMGAELLSGARYVAADRRLRSLLMVSLVVVTVGMPYLVFLPSVAEDRLDVGAAGYGVLSSGGAVAAFLASLYAAGRSSGSAAARLQVISGVAFGAGLLLLAIAQNMVVAVVAVAMIGGAASAFQVVNNTLLLVESDPHYHGRIQGLVMLGFSGFGLLALPLGVLADGIGLGVVLALMAIGCVTATGVYAWTTRPATSRRANR